MKDTKVENPQAAQTAETPEKEFQGYNLSELKYQKALLTIRKEFAKEKFLKDVDDIKKRLPGGENAKNATVFNSGLLGKFAKSLSYMDYIVLGFSIFSTGRKILSVFRKGKK